MATIQQIMARRYSDFQWNMSGQNYSDLNWTDPATKPTEAELLALSASVDTEIALEQDENDKIATIQEVYNPQVQLIEIMRAIRDNDNTKILEILNFWESL